MENIQKLVKNAKAGDDASMDEILQFFKPKVSAICREYFLIGSDFDDILQEGMIGLYKAIINYDETKNDNFVKFATMCIHRQIQNAIRIANSKKNVPLNDYYSISVDEDDDESRTPKIILVTKDRVAENVTLLKEKNSEMIGLIKSNLTDQQYKILSLYLNGYSYSEIAKILEVNSKFVDNSIQTIKRKLKVLLQ